MFMSENNNPVTFQHYVKCFMQNLEDHKESVSDSHYKILIHVNASLPESFLTKPISEITEEDIYCLMASKDLPLYAAGRLQSLLRWCFQKAMLENVIHNDPAKDIRVKRYPSHKPLLSKQDYDRIYDAVYSIPGGKAYGLMAFLDECMKGADGIHYENVDSITNQISYYYRKDKTRCIDHPDGVRLLQNILNDYEEKMSNSDIASKNQQHYLLFTEFGSPYTYPEMLTISQAIQSKCGKTCTYSAFRKYIRIQGL